MKDDDAVEINLTAMAALNCFVMTELLRTLQEKNLITNDEANSAVLRAATNLDRMTIGLTKTETDHMINMLLGRPVKTPIRQLS